MLFVSQSEARDTLASIVLGGAGFPEDALAARSGGRIGGSSGFRSAPRSAPAPRASPRPQINNYNNYSAPPLVGGYRGGYGYGGFSPFGGFGGVNVFPSFGVPLFAGSGFFNLILIAIVFSTVTSVVRSVLGGRRRDDSDDYD
ncbi:hypothetical protein WJX73_010156 [Symbiochloris irregularis]|uniref:Uncharacterized protein n=1 Tax=Symbiochloris irregularis TaxID=706552 RepID=A0AAW1PVE6_9CHLO